MTMESTVSERLDFNFLWRYKTHQCSKSNLQLGTFLWTSRFTHSSRKWSTHRCGFGTRSWISAWHYGKKVFYSTIAPPATSGQQNYPAQGKVPLQGRRLGALQGALHAVWQSVYKQGIPPHHMENFTTGIAGERKYLSSGCACIDSSLTLIRLDSLMVVSDEGCACARDPVATPLTALCCLSFISQPAPCCHGYLLVRT